MAVAEAFQIVNIGPPSRNRGFKPRKGNSETSGSGSEGTTKSTPNSATKHTSQKGKLPPPFCPHPPCKEVGNRHWIDECDKATDAEKATLKAEIVAKKAADGPSKSTRSQKVKFNTRHSGTVGRLKPSEVKNAASCSITVSNGTTSVESTGRFDDGSDDSIVSPRLAELAASKGIGKIGAIKTVKLAVALKKGTKDTAERFSFSRTWTARTILHLASGNLALNNISFLVADDDLACESLLIGIPVLQHFRVDTHILLDNNRFALNGSDCSGVGNPTSVTSSGQVSRLMIARLNGSIKATEQSQTPGDRPRVIYDMIRRQENPFPDPALRDPVDSDQHEDLCNAMDNMVQTGIENRMPNKESKELKNVVQEHVNIFRTSLSSGPPAQVAPLKIVLTPNARPIRVRLRKYSQDQREFLENFVSELVRTGMAYPNPSSPWASAPLIVPKPGPARFRFTVDLRPINQYTVKHQYSMPNIEQELLKLARSRFFATFDLSHGYWQFPNWSGIVTQVPHEDLPKPHKEQRHSPLAFCSGRFNATQLGWSTLEKEGYAIMATVERMHWLTATAAGFDLFTDQNNLIFLFDPLSLVPDLGQSSTRKFLRWAVKLRSHSYTCFHFSGIDNVWADMLTRWSAPNTVRRLIKIPALPSSNAESFCWPSADEIIQQQEANSAQRPNPGTTTDHATLAIIDWCAAFNVPQGLMSDGPTHFKNVAVRTVSKALRVPQHFTLPYTPWSNGAVERLGKEVVRTFRSLSSEFQMYFQEWPDLLPVIQSVLNNAPSPHRHDVAPIMAFLGMKPTPPISMFLHSSTTTPMTIVEAQLERCFNIKALQNLIAELHPLVHNSLQHNREMLGLRASKGTLPNFEKGDFVLVAKEDFNAGEKLALCCRGPRRIV